MIIFVYILLVILFVREVGRFLASVLRFLLISRFVSREERREGYWEIGSSLFVYGS